MNLPRIVFQRFIKFARPRSDPFILIFYLNQRDVLYTRIYLNFLPLRNSWARYYTRENTDTTAEYTRRPVFYCHHRRINMRTVSYYDHKNDKEGYRLSNHLEMLEYIWKRTITDVTCLSLKSMHPQHLFLAIVAIAFEDLAVFSTGNSLPLCFNRG